MPADGRADALSPNIVPLDAATLLVIDRRSPLPRILMGRRHAGHVFMPGKFVFPGGRLEREDGAMTSVGDLDRETAIRLDSKVARRRQGRGRALALAAIRETYEETGLLLGRPHAGELPPLPGWHAFREAGIVPDLSALSFLGRAITPPRNRRRYDTRFFVADRGAVAAEQAGFVGPDKELVELVWAEIAEARRLDLPTVTRAMLAELETRLAMPTGSAEVPLYRVLRGRFLREVL